MNNKSLYNEIQKLEQEILKLKHAIKVTQSTVDFIQKKGLVKNGDLSKKEQLDIVRECSKMQDKLNNLHAILSEKNKSLHAE
jgi:hypothetical protein